MSEKSYERSDELELLARDVIASDERLANLSLANIGYLQADFADIIQSEGVDWAVPEGLT